METTRNLNFSIHKDDMVQAISGRDKGKSGKVLHVDRRDGRVTVEGLNRVKRHMKPSQKTPGGGILDKEVPLHYSKVLLFCAKCNRGVRHGSKLEGAAKASAKKSSAKGKSADAGTGVAHAKKVRVCKRCGEQLGAAH